MGKLTLLKFLSYLALWFASQVFAIESTELLPPEQAFQFTYQVRKADRLLLSWDIATGYYLYRHKFKFVSLTPGIKVGDQSFPASHTKHDEFFGDVEIFRDHLEVEVLLQRQDPKLNMLTLEVAFQGCADVGVCYMPIKKTVSFDLPGESANEKGITPTIDKPAPFVSEQDRIAASLKNGSIWVYCVEFSGFRGIAGVYAVYFPDVAHSFRYRCGSGLKPEYAQGILAISELCNSLPH